MSTSRPGNRDPRYRPSPNSSGGWLAQPRPKRPPSPEYLRKLQLAESRRCQWQARTIRCVAEAVDAVWSKEDVLRSTCAEHLPTWLRTGARRLA